MNMIQLIQHGLVWGLIFGGLFLRSHTDPRLGSTPRCSSTITHPIYAAQFGPMKPEAP